MTLLALPPPRRALRRAAAVAAAGTLALTAACGPGKPKAPPTAPAANALSGFVGQHRILRYQADKELVTVKKSDPAQIPGACDAAVEVRTALLDKGVGRLSLETLG